MEHQINDLKQLLAEYKPGSTIRFARQRPSNPPSHLRIGLFGPTGVGKSAFINSANYATGSRWDHVAPEGFAEEASKTIARKAVDIAENVTLVDNRGMRSLGGPFMVELGHQVSGVYDDGEDVRWEKPFLRRLVAGLERMIRSKPECSIHCAVLVISALNLSLRPNDLKELIETIRSMTGEPPIVVITHCGHEDARTSDLAVFKSGLQQLRIDYVFEIENYTQSDHGYDAQKHHNILEAIHQCAIVGDRVMKHSEEEQGCKIL